YLHALLTTAIYSLSLHDALPIYPSASYTAEKFGASGQEYTITVGQTLELGGKRERRLDSARAATRVTRFELDDVRRQVFAQVKRSEEHTSELQSRFDLVCRLLLE